MKRRGKLTLLAIVSTCGLFFTATSSLATQIGTVTGETVRMREKPTTSSSILINLDEDDKVNVIEKSDDWYKISFNGTEGYVSSKYIKVSEDVKEKDDVTDNNITTNETTENSTQENTSSENSSNENATQDENLVENKEIETKTEEVQTSTVQKLTKDSKIYSMPLISSTAINDIKKDEQVTVIQVLKNWVYVNTEKETGWIIKQNLEEVTETAEADENNKPDETVQEDKETEKSEIKVGYINVETANMREKPTTNSESVLTLTLNKEVTIIGEEDDWYKIKSGSKEGYVYKKLVSNEKTNKTTSRSGTDRTAKTIEKTETVETETTSLETETTDNSEENTTSATGSNIVSYAKKYLGAKYVSGGNGPSAFDCSGFTSYVYRHFGYSLSRTSGGQAGNGTAVDRNSLQQGDIVVFLNKGKSSVGHVGIYIGGNAFIHAANPSKGVITESLSSSYYAERYVGARRII